MGGLVQIFLALCGVCEAEGRALRDNSILLIRKGGYAFLGVCFLGAGLAFLLGALYALLAPLVPDWIMLALVGAAALLCGFCLFRLSGAPRKAFAGKESSAPAPATPREADGREGMKDADAAQSGPAARDGGENER